MTDNLRPAAARLPRLRRTLGIAILCASLLSVLGGGCTWKASSGDHDDCKDLDDDGVCDEGGTVVVIETVTLDESGDDDATLPGIAGPAPLPQILEPPPFDAGYDLSGATLDPGGPGEPPVRRVRDIRHVQFVTARDGALHDPRDLVAFTERVREANAAWIALPVGAGSLRFAGILTTPTLISIAWQRFDPSGRELRGATQEFLLDHTGRLLRIENDTGALQVRDARDVGGMRR